MLFWGGAHTSILWIWPAAGATLLAAGVYILFFGRFKTENALCMIALTVAFVLVVSFISYEALLLLHLNDNAPDGVEYIIVLGAGVNGESPSLALRCRIDAAYEYLSRNPETVAILSGGMGDREHITEAECMRRELCALGISEDRLIIEDRSTNTAENIEYSLSLIEGEYDAVAIVTNNFHVFRALRLLRNRTDKNIYGISAPFDTPLIVHFAVREYVGYFSDYFNGDV